MTAICEEQAYLSRLYRHFDRTIAVVMDDPADAEGPPPDVPPAHPGPRLALAPSGVRPQEGARNA